MDASNRWLSRLDRLQAFLVTMLPALAILAFGGVVWWFPMVGGLLLFLLALVSLIRAWISGSYAIFKSPIGLLGALAIGLAVFQIIPIPVALIGRQSPRTVRVWENRDVPLEAGSARADNSTPVVDGKVILSADRPGTLRWIVGAIGCMTLFVIVGHFVDRLSRTWLVWNSLIVAFGICTWAGGLQIVGQNPDAYGFFSAGTGSAWMPSVADLKSGPVMTRLRAVPRFGIPSEGNKPPVVIAQVDPTFAIGSLITGPGAYLALGSLVIPLIFGMALYRLSPRGSRESLLIRLRPHGGLASLILLLATGLLGLGLFGYLGGLILSSSILLGICIVCLATLRRVGVSRASILFFLMAFPCIYLGHLCGQWFGRPAGCPWIVDSEGFNRTEQVWTEAVRLGLRFPYFGTGLNSFGAVHSQVKHDDAGSSTALSSVLQWWAETGMAGVALVLVGLLWSLRKLPAAWSRVGSADRALPAALLGSAISFGLYSCMAWTIQLPAIAIAAAAICGSINRWLVGGTDLFLEKT